jgi:integrase
MARKLTTKAVENFKPSPQRQEVSDGGSGLYLVIQPSGAKSWAVRYRHEGRPTKLTLGGWPALSLAEARKSAADALHDLARGIDPSGSRKAAKQLAAERAGNTVAFVCDEFLRRERARLRPNTIDHYQQTLHRLVYPAIGDHPVDSLKRSEIVRFLDRVEDGSGTRMADVTLALLRRIFNWHAARSDEFRSPIVKGMARQNEADLRRSRILDDDELRRLWAATSDGQAFSNLVRLLLLTTARRSEVAGMRWEEVTDGIWTLPAARSKTKAEIVRPLSEAAKGVLARQPREADWVFPGASGYFRSYSAAKRILATACGVTNWRLHDLRRTSRSLLSRAGISESVAERCLGHAPPTVVQTYNRYEYRGELLHAFEALAGLIERITNPTENIVAIRR